MSAAHRAAHRRSTRRTEPAPAAPRRTCSRIRAGAPLREARNAWPRLLDNLRRPEVPHRPAGRDSGAVLTTLVVAAQIALAIVLGAAIGLERELSAQPAGLRTHMLVALGAVIVTLAGAHVAANNPATLAAPVITGVGFLGGGAILREGTGVRGLTTAASLWVTAAVGVAVGLRQWLPACAATLLAIAVL